MECKHEKENSKKLSDLLNWVKRIQYQSKGIKEIWIQ